MGKNRDCYPTPYNKKAKKPWERDRDRREKEQRETLRKTCPQCGELRCEEDIEWNMCRECGYTKGYRGW